MKVLRRSQIASKQLYYSTKSKRPTMARTTKTHGGSSVATKALAMIVIASILVTEISAAPTAEGSQPQEQLQQELNLVCEATSTLGQNEQPLDGREGMEVENIEAPSTSPSMSMPCEDLYSNIRGSYTSFKAPCRVTFHNADTDNTLQEDGESDQPMRPWVDRKGGSKDEGKSPLYYHGTSSECGIDNAIGEAKEYVEAWPDECVGDFARCYDLKNPHHFLCEELKKLLEGWWHRQRNEALLSERSNPVNIALLPPGTTHISIDCTIDREALRESYERKEHLAHVKIRETVLADKERTLYAVVSVLIAVLIVLFAISHLVVQPIVGAIGGAYRRQDRNESEERYHFDSLTANHSSSLRLETDGDVSDVHVEVCNAIQETHFMDETETATATVSSPQQTVQMSFDTVPIVPVTILPVEVIHAEVIQEGVSYVP